MLISLSVLFVHVKEFQRNQFTQKQCARGSLMRITRHTKIETPKRKMKQNFVLQYILYACTNVTKRVNREINARGDERRKMIRIGENTTHTTLHVKSTTTTGPTSLFFLSKQPSKLNPVTVEAMNILFDLPSLVAPDTLFTMVLLSIHLPVILNSSFAAIRQ